MLRDGWGSILVHNEASAFLVILLIPRCGIKHITYVILLLYFLVAFQNILFNERENYRLP